MSSPASIASHPLHPMLVSLPIGLWTFSFACDLVRMLGGAPLWSTVALYALTSGTIGAILAAFPGLLDYFSIEDPKLRKTATAHLLAALGSLLIFGIELWMRSKEADTSRLSLLLSLLGMGLMGTASWLGAGMVYVSGLAVDAVEKMSLQLSARQPRAAPENRRNLKRAG